MNEKVFFSLLAHGMDQCPDGDSKTGRLFVDGVTECGNAHIFGDVKSKRRGQWKFPLRDNGKQVEPRSVPNVNSRKCIVGLKHLIPVIFDSSVDQKSSWNPNGCPSWHQPMMASLRQQDDFTDEGIDNVHIVTSQFMDLWCLCSLETMSPTAFTLLELVTSTAVFQSTETCADSLSRVGRQ